MDAESIVRTYADMVYKIAYRYTRNADDAEDVFSEVWLAHFKKERVFETEEHRKAWLIRVTINAAKQLLGEREFHEEITDYLEEAAAPQGLGPETRMDLRDAIEKLRPEYKEVICLYYLQDLPVKTIAEILNKNENTVKIHLMRAREQLRDMLGEQIDG